MKKLFCALLAAAFLLSLAACSKAPEAEPADEAPDWQAQYDLGVRYLSEGNYEEAILAFEAAIKIDPKNADAYRKLAEAYEKTGDEDAALRTLETGAEATGDRELADLAGKKRQELDEPETSDAETSAKSTRDEQIEQLSGWFPQGVGANCAEYVSYAGGFGVSAYDPGFSPMVDDPANTYVLYRSVVVDGANGPECYALYGNYADYETRVWQWVLYYGLFAENGVVVTGELRLPTMDIYNAQSEVVLYWDESRSVWCLEVCNMISRFEASADGADITAFSLSDEPRVIGTWQKDDYYFFNTGIAGLMEEMRTAGLPHVIRGATDCLMQGEPDKILCGTSARQAIWLYRCDHIALGSDPYAENPSTTHLRRDWLEWELAEQEQWVQKHALDAIERDAAMERYQLEFRPELTREEADYCYGYDEGPCGGYAIMDTKTGQSAATICITFRDEDKKDAFYKMDREASETYTIYADGCIVYWIPDAICHELSFDTRTGKLFELQNVDYPYEAAGKYLVGSYGVSEDNLVLMTPRGELVAKLTAKPYERAVFFIRGNMVYFCVSDDTRNAEAAECEVWRYNVESGEKVCLGTVPTPYCTYICDDFVEYYESRTRVRMYF